MRILNHRSLIEDMDCCEDIPQKLASIDENIIRYCIYCFFVDNYDPLVVVLVISEDRISQMHCKSLQEDQPHQVRIFNV